MNTDNDRLIRRREYVFRALTNRSGTLADEVNHIADGLFLNERTIYRDYYQAREERNFDR